MVTLDNLGNQKLLSLMLNELILKVTKFQLPHPKRLGTVVKNILGGPSWNLPMSNMVKSENNNMLTFCSVSSIIQIGLLFLLRTENA